MFESITKNKTKTTFIVAGIFIFFAVIVYFVTYYLFELGYFAGIVAVVAAFLGSFFTYWNSDKIVLSMHKARPATPEQDAKLHNILTGLCLAAGTPVPRLYVVDDHALNAFATGRNPDNAVICVTSGLLETLDYYQLEGVVAHELAHIKNYDILLQTVAGIMIGAAMIIARIAMRTMFYGGGKGGKSKSSGKGGGQLQLIIFAVGIIFIILAPIAGQFLKMMLSRNREYLADATGAEFTRNPEGLASALEVIGGNRTPLMYSSSATEGMYIATPRTEFGSNKSASLFSTHPPISDRVEALRNLR